MIAIAVGGVVHDASSSRRPPSRPTPPPVAARRSRPPRRHRDRFRRARACCCSPPRRGAISTRSSTPTTKSRSTLDDETASDADAHRARAGQLPRSRSAGPKRDDRHSTCTSRPARRRSKNVDIGNVDFDELEKEMRANEPARKLSHRASARLPRRRRRAGVVVRRLRRRHRRRAQRAVGRRHPEDVGRDQRASEGKRQRADVRRDLHQLSPVLLPRRRLPEPGKYEQAIADFEKTAGPGETTSARSTTLMQRAKTKLEAARLRRPSRSRTPQPRCRRVPDAAAGHADARSCRAVDRSRAAPARAGGDQRREHGLGAAQQRKADGSPQYAQAMQALADANAKLDTREVERRSERRPRRPRRTRRCIADSAVGPRRSAGSPPVTRADASGRRDRRRRSATTNGSVRDGAGRTTSPASSTTPRADSSRSRRTMPTQRLGLGVPRRVAVLAVRLRGRRRTNRRLSAFKRAKLADFKKRPPRSTSRSASGSSSTRWGRCSLVRRGLVVHTLSPRPGRGLQVRAPHAPLAPASGRRPTRRRLR